jgi:hypothetical protein
MPAGPLRPVIRIIAGKGAFADFASALFLLCRLR